ncbi:S41 family peptidase [Flexithrix dorotheae]|uniref:S41 family peptidase n=1 Tax=Flexithrix dorotheae TaxID=70993 RepID=UPI00037F32D2|nr:S41 family peptidase [Flexithrix dorotheae]
MKNIKTALLCLILCVSHSFIFAKDKLAETEKLAATAQVWGFLKYYHPSVAKGKYNWDEELFKVLPKVKEAESKTQLSQIYINWIDRLGKVKECKNCGNEPELEYFSKNFDLSWMENNKLFTPDLTEKLKFIEDNRHQGKKHYVSQAKRVRNIIITNEIDYKDFDWQDENLRLLSLFRYWNIVEYFFPYKYQTDTDWEEVLNTMIPKFLYPESETDFHLAMLELIINLDDSHANFFSDITESFWGYYLVPAGFKLIDNKAVLTRFYDDSLARIDDLRVGDVITKIDDKDVWEVFKEKEKYINGSNVSRKKYIGSHVIFMGSSGSINIEYTRDGKTHSKSIKRYLRKDFNFNKKERKPFKVLEGNIGYINMGVIKNKDVEEAMEALNDTKAIIFDLRNYPKGTLYSLILHISSKKNNFYKVTYPDLDYPGKFIWRDGNQCGINGDLKYLGKIILLVNESSQSHSEFTIMCLQTGDNVTTLGSQTSGADGNVSRFDMVGGFKTAISGIGIFYPDGTETQRKGVKIDIEVKPTIQGIKDGRDEVLEKAIEFLSEL